ncbi:MAG: hypothetical protein AAFR64_04355 [Pseudomonadota bacterium]
MSGISFAMAFPPTSELDFLIGKEVAQVAFVTDGIRFIWWEGGEIRVTSDFEHKDQKGVCYRLGDVFRDPPSLLHRLIQSKVSAIQVNDCSLTLTFDDGQELIFDSTGIGENGLIQIGADLSDGWIVF